MDRRLFTPKWLIAHLTVILIVAGFVRLGFWQLDRLEERQAVNAIGTQRLAMDPVPFESIAHQTPESIEYRRVVVKGRPLPFDEVLIRSQVHLGAVGYHLITPLSYTGSSTVLVNRGWVPLGTEVGTVETGAVEGVITVEGWIHPTQERPPLGPEDPVDGRLTVMSRVDIDRVARQVDYSLASVYIVAIGERGSDLPVPITPPMFDDEGPHLAYAIQWFAFSLIAAVGYGFLARQRLQSSA